MSREPDSPTLGAREPKHPLHLVNREATDRKARHIRPDYGAMDVKRETEEIDNLDYAARGLFAYLTVFSSGLIVFCRHCSQFGLASQRARQG